MGEDLAEVFPYQLVEPRPRRVARPATVFGDDLGVPPAHVVAAAVPAGAGVGALPASPAAEEGPQEVAVALVVARGEPPLVVGELLLDQIEGLAFDDLRNRDADPLLLWAPLGGEARPTGASGDLLLFAGAR